MKKYMIIFSPTGGTAKVSEAITKKWSDVETIDLSDNNRSFEISLENDALAIISMPSFGGVAPQLALDRLAKMNANHAKCAIVAVYGNRAYENTLIQMKDYAENAGFEVIAAVAAIAEHSIIHQYANGRPSADDCEQLCNFGERILEKASKKSETFCVPGNKNYKKAGAMMIPKANSSCNACGLCAKRCPAGAIDPAKPRTTDKTKCIGCMRCVSLCPVKARKVSAIMTKIAAFVLKKACSNAKANELII